MKLLFTSTVAHYQKVNLVNLQRECMIQICQVLIFSWHLMSVEMYDFEICSSLTFQIEFYRIGFKDCNCNILLLTYICVNSWPTLAFVHILNSWIATKDFSMDRINILWTRMQILDRYKSWNWNFVIMIILCLTWEPRTSYLNLLNSPPFKNMGHVESSL